jgi:hypothetical protein
MNEIHSIGFVVAEETDPALETVFKTHELMIRQAIAQG